MEKFQAYINGQLTDAASGEYVRDINPATGEAVYEVVNCTEADIDRAVDVAYDAQKSWAKLTIMQRGDYLRKFGQVILAHAEELALILSQEQGKTLEQSRGEIIGAVGLMDYFANSDRHVEGEILPGDNNKENILIMKEPLGVVACIMPWNFPIYVLLRKLAPALLAGCTVVCKPSGDTPASTLYLGRLMDEVGFPAGVVNFIAGRGRIVGPAFAKNPKVAMITVTGSTETGQEILRLSAENICKVSLELGGKAPAIVMEDADLELAARCVTGARLNNAGQVCSCAERLYVQESIADKFIELMKQNMAAATYGDGVKDPSLTMGALINKDAVIRIQGMVDRAVEQGAEILMGGRLPEGPGAFYPPTLLTNVKQDSEIMQHEVFGPVLPIVTFKTAAEALALANDCQYGLTSSLYTNDYNTVMLFSNNIEFGELYVNRQQGEAYQGFHAGWKKSGVGGDDGRHGLEEFYQTRTVYLDYQTDLY